MLSYKQMESMMKTRAPFSPSIIVTHLLRPIGMTAVAAAPQVPSQVKTWLSLLPTVPK